MKKHIWTRVGFGFWDVFFLFFYIIDRFIMILKMIFRCSGSDMGWKTSFWVKKNWALIFWAKPNDTLSISADNIPFDLFKKQLARATCRPPRCKKIIIRIQSCGPTRTDLYLGHNKWVRRAGLGYLGLLGPTTPNLFLFYFLKINASFCMFFSSNFIII